jgi:hypothetical protein
MFLQITDSIAKAESLEYQEPWKIAIAAGLLIFIVVLAVSGFSKKRPK